MTCGAVHTYKVHIVTDIEAPDPVMATEAIMELLASGQWFPIIEVRQFVDTDAPDKVYEVDTKDFTIVEETL